MASFIGFLSYTLACYVVSYLWHLIRTQRAASSNLDNIPGPPSMSFWTGNLDQFFDRRGLDFHRHLAEDYGPVVSIHGSFGRKILYVFDPRALHSMIIKEHTIFQEGSDFINANLLVFGPGLVSTVGEQHRKQRKMLNPVFSISHMRRLLPTFYEVTRRLHTAMLPDVKKGQEIDVHNWMARASLEIIGQGGLGYSFDPLLENLTNDYGEALKSTFAALQGVFMLRPLLPYVTWLGPAWLRRFMVDLVPYPPLQRLKKLVDIMADRSVKLIQAKKQAFENGDVDAVKEGEDIMSILVKMNLLASEEDKLPEADLIAQVSTLTLAGMDTTSNTLSRILHVLSEYPEVQRTLRAEIVDAGLGLEPSYDCLNQLPYMDAVLRETLRLFPPATLLSREATQDTILPLSQSLLGKDGCKITEIPIQEGTEIFIGVLGNNTNKAIWGDDALEFKPERWLSTLPETALNAPIPGVYSKLMTFLGGKRSCIGFKFAEIAIKAVLYTLLPTFTFQPTERCIAWNVATVNYPTVGAESLKPEMPLKVALVEDSS